MTGREQPRHPVERRAEIVSVSLLGGPRVKRHPRPQGVYLPSPLFQEKGFLGCKRRLKGIEGCGEGGAESITYGLEDETTVPLYGFLEDLVVTSEGNPHRRCVSLPQLGGALYVGEQEGDSAGGHSVHWSLTSSF